MIGQMDRWQQVIGDWAAETFRDQTDDRVIAHLVEEVEELRVGAMTEDSAATRDGLADCLILLLCLAHRHGISAADAVGEKHAVNQRRFWRFDADRGYDRHTDPEPPARPDQEGA